MPAFGSQERPVHTAGTDLHFALCQLQRFAQAQKASMTRASASYGFDFLNLGLGGRTPASAHSYAPDAHANNINASTSNPSPPCTPAAPSSQPPLPPTAPPLPASGSQRSTTSSSAPSSARNHSHNSWTIPTPPRPPSPKQVPRKDAIGSSSSSQKHKSLSRSQSAQPGSMHHTSSQQHTAGGHAQPQAAPAHSSSSSSAKPQSSSTSSSSRDRRKEKENLPSWAQPAAVKQSLKRMTRLDPDEIFAPPTSCDLNELFGPANSGSRRKRTSSANWTPDQFTALEEVEYKGVLGLEKGLTSQFIRDNSPARA